MANWVSSAFTVVVMCRKRLSSPRCRSELIDSAWVVNVPGQKCVKNINNNKISYMSKSLIKRNIFYCLMYHFVYIYYLHNICTSNHKTRVAHRLSAK